MVQGDTYNASEAVLPNGLVSGHAYSVTGVESIEISPAGYDRDHEYNDATVERLIRVRNPWGSDTEWKGAFGDRCASIDTCARWIAL